MIRPDRAPRLAVLIDADNASPRIVAGLFEEIAKIGEASVRRIYGDFSSSRSQGWADVLARYAIIPQQQFAWVTGKNASDITLVIDAMDLLHSGRQDGFCLVSSDSDFTRLAARIREQGVDVFGFGEKKTPESFRQACRRFIYTENLLPERATTERAPSPLEQPATASDLLRRVIGQMETEDGWVSLGSLGKQIANVSSDFDPRTYGFKKLSDLIRSTASFEVDDVEPTRIRVRLKPRARPVAVSADAARGEPSPRTSSPSSAGTEPKPAQRPAAIEAKREPAVTGRDPAPRVEAGAHLPPAVASPVRTAATGASGGIAASESGAWPTAEAGTSGHPPAVPRRRAPSAAAADPAAADPAPSRPKDGEPPPTRAASPSRTAPSSQREPSPELGVGSDGSMAPQATLPPARTKSRAALPFSPAALAALVEAREETPTAPRPHATRGARTID